MSVAFRPACSHDRRFVVANWVSSFRHSDAGGVIASEDWQTVMWPQIEKVIDREGTTTIVAYDTDETDHVADLYGFISGDTRGISPFIYYVYVKQAHRRRKFARRLFAALGVDPSLPFRYGYKTAWCDTLARKIPCSRWAAHEARRPLDINRRASNEHAR